MLIRDRIWQRCKKVCRRKITFKLLGLSLLLVIAEFCSVAQWWSGGLLTRRLWVRVPPEQIF